MMSLNHVRTFLRYFFSGGVAAGIHFAILILLVEKYSFNPTLSTGIGFCIAVIFNYLVQFHWTFKVRGPHSRYFVRFLVVTLMTLGLNTGLFWLYTEYLQWPYVLAQVVATGIVFLLNFFVNYAYTFKSAKTNCSVKRNTNAGKSFTKIIRYLIFGSMAAIVHFAVLILLIEQYTIDATLATAVGFCIAVIFKYLIQFQWAFYISILRRFFFRFLSLTIFTLGINTGLFWLFTEQLLQPYLHSQIAATGIVFLFNASITYLYNFKRDNLCKHESA